jgi:hypothetical protein
MKLSNWLEAGKKLRSLPSKKYPEVRILNVDWLRTLV